MEIPQLQYTVKVVDVSAEMRIQKTAQMPQVQFIEKLVDDTVLRRTSSGSPSPTANSRDASDSGSGNSTEW